MKCICYFAGLARALVATALLLNAVSLLASAESAIDVGTRKQLFVDHKFIRSGEGIRLTMHVPFQTGEKLVVADRPWEKGAHVYFYSSVMKEEGPDGARIRLWYDLVSGKGHPGSGFRAVAYAESDDGIHFRKPILGLVQKDGSKQNNLVMPTDLSVMTVGGGSVLRDENPDCPPAERYKSWSKAYRRQGKSEAEGELWSTIRGGHQMWHSADGLRWHPYQTAATGLRAADTQPTWFWDSRIGRYVGYSRELPPRMVGYNESDDFLHWEHFSLALKPDARDLGALAGFLPHSPLSEAPQKAADVEPVFGKGWTVVAAMPLDFYGTGVFKYAEAEDVYVAMLPVYYHWRSPHAGPSTADVQLAVSRDGRRFQRLGGRRPFLRLGPEGSFASRWVWPLVQPVRMGDQLWIYYVGGNRDHAGRVAPKAAEHETAISRAILRLDGFVSVDADYGGASFTTPPLVFEGSRLELNVDTSAGGVALVEIQDASGQPIPGHALGEADEINGNSVRFPVTWRANSDISQLAGQPVRLCFKLRDCHLYAFQFVK